MNLYTRYKKAHKLRLGNILIMEDESLRIITDIKYHSQDKITVFHVDGKQKEEYIILGNYDSVLVQTDTVNFWSFLKEIFGPRGK